MEASFRNPSGLPFLFYVLRFVRLGQVGHAREITLKHVVLQYWIQNQRASKYVLFVGLFEIYEEGMMWNIFQDCNRGEFLVDEAS